MMKKTANADIANLFSKFGGDTGTYQEIQQEYVSDKAQQNWPIVKAMERAHAAEPTLRAATVRNSRAPVSHSVFSIAPSSANTESIAPSARSVRPIAGSRDTSLSAMLNKSAPVQSAVAPLRSLFSKMNDMAKPGEMNTQSKAWSALKPAQPAQVCRSENDPLNSVFSRLLSPKNSAHVSSPERSLRSMLGFLNK
jgi:hypothetical protein